MNWSETVNTPKSISELRRLRKCLAARKRMLTIQVKKTKARLDKVIHEDPTGKTPVQILNSSPLEVHKALAKILGVTSTDSQTLIRNLRETAQGFWPRRFSSKLPTYEKILKKVCKNSKIKVEHTLTIEQNIILYQSIGHGKNYLLSTKQLSNKN